MLVKAKRENRRLNHQVKETKPRKVDRDRLKNYLTDNSDAYLTEIATEFGCHPTTIHYLLKLWGTFEKKNHTYYGQDLEKVALFLKNFNSLKHLAPVYIDETGFDTYFYREYGRSLKGQLIRGKVSGRRYQRISLVAGLTNGELIAPMTYEETMTSDFFEAWFQKFLLPTLNTPSVIIMDNARFHRMGKLELLCEEFGHKLLPLPPYSPEYNPIEKTWAHIKKHLKKVLPSCNTFFEALCLVLVSIDYIIKSN